MEQVPGVDYRTNYNNFVDTNWSSINTLFETENEVAYIIIKLIVHQIHKEVKMLLQSKML